MSTPAGPSAPLASLIKARGYIPALNAISHAAGFEMPVTIGNVYCTLTPAAGHYQVDINRIAYGNGMPSIPNNSAFFIGATNYTLATAAVLGVEYRYTFYVQLDGSTAIGVVALGNGSVNIGVTCGITATKIP